MSRLGGAAPLEALKQVFWYRSGAPPCSFRSFRKASGRSKRNLRASKLAKPATSVRMLFGRAFLAVARWGQPEPSNFDSSRSSPGATGAPSPGSQPFQKPKPLVSRLGDGGTSNESEKGSGVPKHAAGHFKSPKLRNLKNERFETSKISKMRDLRSQNA